MENICVFCGSSVGNKPIYTQAAIDLGKEMVKRKYKLIYGGGNVGLMGEIAEVMLPSAVEVIGVIPKALLEKEVAHPGVKQMHISEDMFSRKKLLMEISDAFVALPGGFGTLDELFEMLVHFQLHLHDKPVAILNVNGFYDHLIKFIERMGEDQFIKSQHSQNIIIESDVKTLLDRIEQYSPEPIDGKWIENLKKDNVYK